MRIELLTALNGDCILVDNGSNCCLSQGFIFSFLSSIASGRSSGSSRSVTFDLS